MSFNSNLKPLGREPVPGTPAESPLDPQPDACSVGVDLLGASREWESTAASIARLAVETFSDWSIVDIIDEQGVQHRVAVDHADPTKSALAAEIRDYPPNPAVSPAVSETIRAGRSLLASIVGEREIDRRARDPRQAELARRIGMASYIVSPLVARGRVLGTVSFMRVNRKRPFTQGDVPRAEEIARQAALAIDNARLATEARKAAERNARLQNVTAALSEAISPRKVVDTVLEQSMASLGAETGGVWLVTPDGKAVELIGARNFDERHAHLYERLELARIAPLTDAIRTGEAVWLESRASFATRYPTSPGPAVLPSAELAIACLPLSVQGRIIGGLVLTFRSARYIDSSERAFLLAIARQCAQALERARLYEDERRARAEAEAANRLLQAVVRSAPLAIALMEADGTVRMWNPAAERITGWSADEVIGRPIPSMGEPPGEAVRHSVASVTAGNAVEGYEVVRQRKSGEPVTVAVWAVPLAVAEGETRCLSMGVDITARKRAEERIRFLAEASEVLASSLDYERTLEAVARLAVPAIASIAVVDGPRFDASAPLAVASEDPEHEELVREMRRRYPLRDVDTITLAMRTGEPRLYVHPPFERIRCFAVDEEHARMIARTGTRASMVVPLIARGQTLGVFSFASRDRLYDEQDLAFAVELARRAATAIDNARLYRELQEAVRIREDFLTAAGYELRTPITAIHLQLASVIRLARRGVPHDEIAQCAERATRSLDRLVRLSNDLLDISWLGDRKLAIEPTPTDLRQEVCEALARLRGELARAGCAVEFEARDPVRGHWDRLRLSQLIACILSNAMKYGAGRPIHIRVSREGVGARLTVQDQGIGIAPENQARIFNRFERADAPNHYGGLGMGLWIARQVVEAHGGTIRVESAPGRGALFQVDLPPGPEGTTPEAT